MKKTILKKGSLLIACVCAALLQGNVLAAEIATTEEISEYDLGEVLVTATRTKLAEEKVPMANEVITAEDIKNSGATNVREALRKALNVDVQETSMVGNKVQIRGMSTNHTLILIDGQRMAGENTSATMNVYDLNRVNLNDVERIEIIRGTSSSLYGSDAMGGVINIITKKATEASTAVGAFAGSKENGGYFNYSSGQQGKNAFKIGGNFTKERRRMEDGSSNMYGPKNYLNLGYDYVFDDNRGLEFKADFIKEELTADADATATALATKERYNNTRSSYSVNYYGHFDKNDYNLRASYSSLKKDNNIITGTSYSDWDDQNYDVFTVEGKNSYQINEKNLLTYGGEFNKTGYESTRMGAGGDGAYSSTKYGITKDASHKNMDTFAVYVQDEYQTTDDLFLIPSVRYDHHNSFGGEISPKIGATYELSEGLRIKANYGLGYRAPTAFELYSQMDRTMGRMRVQVLGNPNLDPEKSTSFDFGIEGERGKSSGKISYFHSEVNDLITTGAQTMIPGTTGMIIRTEYENIDKAKLNGIEGQYIYDFDKHWSAKTTYTYLEATDESDGSRLDGRAKHNGTIELTYTNAKENPLVATLWNRWYKDYLYNSNNYTYQTVNFVVNKQVNSWVGKQMSAYAGIDNIFDKEFTQDTTHTYAIDGRMWKIGVELKL